jgi:hypothetical protein
VIKRPILISRLYIRSPNPACNQYVNQKSCETPDATPCSMTRL